MDFVKECWNKNLSATEFVSSLSNKYSTNEISELAGNLLSHCCSSSYISSPISSYISAIIAKYPEIIMSKITDSSTEPICAIATIFSNFGDIHHSKYPIGSKEASYCSIRDLYICLLCPDRSIVLSSISALCQEQSFSVNIAAAMYHHHDLFSNTHDLFWKVDPFSSIRQTLSFTQVLLVSALSKTPLKRPDYYVSQYTSLAFFAFSFFLWNQDKRQMSVFSSFVSNELFRAVLDDFINTPTIFGALIVSDICIRVILDSKDIKSDPKSRDSIYLILNEVIDQNEDPKTVIGIPIEKLVNLLSEYPPSVEPDNIVETTLKYPAFSLNLVDSVNGFIKTSVDMAIKVITQLEPIADEFSELVIYQGKLWILVSSLEDILPKVEDSLSFEKVWTFFLEMFKYIWKNGSDECRSDVTTTLAKLSNNFQRTISIFINLNLPQGQSTSESDVRASKTHLDRCFAFVDFDINNKESAFKLMNEYSYLWSIALAKGLSRSDLSKHKFPNIPFYTYLFRAMKEGGFRRMWQTERSIVDFDFFLELAPENPDEIQFSLQIDISSIVKLKGVTHSALRRAVILWRALIYKYGVGEFTKQLLTCLKNSMTVHGDPSLLRGCFQICALILSLACDKNPTKIWEAQNAVEEVVGINITKFGEGLALFSIVLVVVVPVEWERRFQYLMNLTMKIMRNDGLSSPRMMYAYSVVKTSLFIPVFRKMVPDCLLEILIQKNDWSSAVQFFICKAESEKD